MSCKNSKAKNKYLMERSLNFCNAKRTSRKNNGLMINSDSVFCDNPHDLNWAKQN